jgi:hypothetical protein
MNEFRRLLERLQHPVRRLVVQRVHPLQHEHAAPRLERGPGGGCDDGLVHVLHAHHVGAARSHPREVGVRSVLDPQPDGLLVLDPLGQQLGGEGPGHPSLAGARRTVEEIRVRGPARQGAREDDARLRVVLRARKRPRTGAHAGASLRAASTAARTSA